MFVINIEGNLFVKHSDIDIDHVGNHHMIVNAIITTINIKTIYTSKYQICECHQHQQRHHLFPHPPSPSSSVHHQLNESKPPLVVCCSLCSCDRQAVCWLQHLIVIVMMTVGIMIVIIIIIERNHHKEVMILMIMIIIDLIFSLLILNHLCDKSFALTRPRLSARLLMMMTIITMMMMMEMRKTNLAGCRSLTTPGSRFVHAKQLLESLQMKYCYPFYFS